MSQRVAVPLFLVGLFAGMAMLVALGRAFGLRQQAKAGAEASPGFGAMEGAIFGLLGLLVAFTFSGAATRFDYRRQLILQEANEIGTAYLRLDLLPSAAQPALRASFRAYVDARLRGFNALPDVEAAEESFAEASALQGPIWRQAVAASMAERPAELLLLPALNDMFDITTTRQVAFETHVPVLIFGMLGLLALACSFIAGASASKTAAAGLLQVLAFPLVFTVCVYVVLDLEFPRAGLIRIHAADHVIADVRKTMGPP